MLALAIAVPLVVFIHLLAIALAGYALGVPVREFSFGFGPTLLRRGIVRIALLPLGGYVKFKDSRDEIVPAHEMKSALDGKPAFQQVLVALSGCAALAALAFAAMGTACLPAALDGIRQLFVGMASPTADAHRLLHDALAFARSAPFVLLLGTVAAKLAAINLLPLPALNGGVALAALARPLGLDRAWPAAATTALMLVWLAVVALWAVAVVSYGLEAAGA
jgi:membrane-associated protease RseP (regulator of RpoE activity)